jgi:hypothetical protein
MIKFPTRNGIDEEKKDQTTKNCYMAALKPEEVGGQVLPIEDTNVRQDSKAHQGLGPHSLSS